MNNTLKNKALLILILAIVSIGLSTVIFSRNSLSNVRPCVQSPVCDPDVRQQGTLTITKFGFPRAYRETASFEPQDKTNYASTSIETKGVSYITIAINTVFWFALLYLVSAAFTKKRLAKPEQPEQP